ncbi:hypothetical protein HRbin40_02120 [bacterium HR40]|nr:hypothetical protein HRbin40_02120 [bacterium HR40]
MLPRVVLLSSLLWVAATAAYAHTGVDAAGGFGHGFAHPLTGSDHVLAMLAVGMLAFASGGHARWSLPATFIGGALVGGLLGASGLLLPALEPILALSVLALAGPLATALTLPSRSMHAAVAGFGLFHGMAHGAEIPVDAPGWAYGIGFLLATALLHAAGSFAAFALADACGRGRVALRATAVFMAIAGGMLFLERL